MDYRNKVVIVIPVYKTSLDVYESVALRQLHRVLGRYAMCFVAPQGLQMSYGILGENIKVEWFDKSYFISKNTYSTLLLSPDFYNRFSDFEYMLIYQLDAFVFSDQLEQFCSLGFDYIGAPVSRWVPEWRILKKRIGNGGFSLRKVQSCRALCQRKDEIFVMNPDIYKENKFLLWEDIFFAFSGTLPELEFRTPGYGVAQSFAVEHDGGRAYKKIHNGWRPFGCHAWRQIDYCFWRPFIEAYGYELPKELGTEVLPTRMNLLINYSVSRCLRNNNLMFRNASNIRGSNICIWGWGIQGKLCYKFVRMHGFNVKYIYENRDIFEDVSVPILRPTDDLLLGSVCPIIVATTKYQTEMSEKLERLDMRKGKEYFLWSDLKYMALKEVIQRLII